jgi:hypothetical protein
LQNQPLDFGSDKLPLYKYRKRARELDETTSEITPSLSSISDDTDMSQNVLRSLLANYSDVDDNEKTESKFS